MNSPPAEVTILPVDPRDVAQRGLQNLEPLLAIEETKLRDLRDLLSATRAIESSAKLSADPDVRAAFERGWQTLYRTYCEGGTTIYRIAAERMGCEASWDLGLMFGEMVELSNGERAFKGDLDDPDQLQSVAGGRIVSAK